MKTQKTTSRVMLALMLMCFSFFNSCEKNEGVDMPTINNGSNSSEIDQGSTIQRDFMGRIVNASSMPLGNVNISIGNKTTITDDNGVFMIDNASVKQKQAFITAEKSGYLKGMRSVVPTQGVNNTSIMLIAENLSGTVASGVASEVSLGNGTKVSFDGAFKDESGSAYSGNVDVYMYHLDPANPNVEDVMPGNLQAINTGNEERLLETYGMLNVELKGDSGQKLNIADGHVAEIEMPVDPAQNGVAPSTIPLWHFDEVNGYWVEDGEANLIGGKYIGEVSHFSWWNCDAQFPTVTLCLNIVDSSNIPLSNVKTELWRSGATYGRVGYSNGDGEICGLIPANETLTLKAFDLCGVEVFSTTVGPFSTNTNYGDVVMSTVSAVVVTGNLVNCSNNNVVNGYTALLYGSQYAAVDVTNGSFSLSVIQCPSLPSFELEGVDFDTFQTTTVLPFNFSNINVGNIIACSTVSEFITLQVDNNATEYYLTNLGANAYQQGVGFSIGAQTSNGYFYIGSDTITPGNYALDQFGFEASSIDLDYSIPTNLQLNLSNYGSMGNYIDATINGTYTDNQGLVKSLSVTIHVIRDN
ncbi:hypothetical protein [Lacinutrix algicola]|uniref:hypothetical protein n=1 Tax=Lacinutrix algicola TaxID=342954 RepID=UPI0006E3FB86|nr:hypothetical protein [Lacinutrix algicola]